MQGLEKTWARQDAQSVAGKFRDAVKPQGALKPRIQQAVTKIQVQTQKLDSMLEKLEDRDSKLFQKIVTAMERHDTNASRVMSGELAEIRKVKQRMSGMKTSLEQVSLRLTTMHELGDAMVELSPAMATMKELKPALGKFMPEADAELGTMTQILGGMFGESLTGEFASLTPDVADEETARILEQASAVAEQQTSEKFPSVPTPGISQNTPSASTFE